MAEFDIVIHGGRVIDGTGNPWFYGDVGIKNGKIASIRQDQSRGWRARYRGERSRRDTGLHRHAHS
jgi:N-acyl-D-amino-acid deacylase